MSGNDKIQQEKPKKLFDINNPNPGPLLPIPGIFYDSSSGTSDFNSLQTQNQNNSLLLDGRVQQTEEDNRYTVPDSIFINQDSVQFKEKIENKLGSGSYSKGVYEGFWNYIEVAVKILKCLSNSEITENDMKEIQVESMKVAKTFNNPNILIHYGLIKGDPLHIPVMQLLHGPSLYTFLGDPDNKLSFKVQLNWLLQIAKGMQYLHSQDIPSLDLKTKNIMLDKMPIKRAGNDGTTAFYDDEELKSINLKVIDLSECLLYKYLKIKKLEKLICTVLVASPESLKSDYSKACDIWSFACLIFEIVEHKSIETLRPELVISEDYKLPFSEEANKVLVELANRCRVERFEITFDVIVNILRDLIYTTEVKIPSFDLFAI